MGKTLEELKRENAEAETAEVTAPQAEIETEETKAAVVETEETEEVAETSEEATEEAPVETWMQAEEQTSDNGDQVPVSKHVAVKHKLKGTIKEQVSEIEQLKAQIEELKTSPITPPATPAAASEIGARPKLDDYDYDDDRYNAALDAWYDAKMEAKLLGQQQTVQQNTQQQEVAQKLTQSVDDHYKRAATLIETAGIKPELYQTADTSVRRAIEAVKPGQGEQITDFIISTLGEGSEKVMYKLGIDSTAQAELQSKLINDPSGMQAMAYLGRLSEKVNAPVKRKSKAPAPAATLQGDAQGDGSAASKAMLKKYKAAKDTQSRFDVRREARKAGVDVSNW